MRQLDLLLYYHGGPKNTEIRRWSTRSKGELSLALGWIRAATGGETVD